MLNSTKAPRLTGCPCGCATGPFTDPDCRWHLIPRPRLAEPPGHNPRTCPQCYSAAPAGVAATDAAAFPAVVLAVAS